MPEPVTMQDYIDARHASMNRLAKSVNASHGEKQAAKQWADATRKQLIDALRKHGPVVAKRGEGWWEYFADDALGYGISIVDMDQVSRPPLASEVIVDADPVRPLLPLEQAG